MNYESHGAHGAYGALIKQARQKLGLSQSELAAMSGVSLPSIQKLEYSQANPSVKTLGAVLRNLGLQMAVGVRRVGIDWDLAAHLGLALSSVYQSSGKLSSRKKIADSRMSQSRTPQQLAHLLRDLSLWRAQQKQMSSREQEALEALAMAAADHYPTFFHKVVRQWPHVKNLAALPRTGRHIKLRRISLAIIGQYL